MITFREKILEPQNNNIDFNLALSPDIINMIINLRFDLDDLEKYFESKKMIELRKMDDYHFLDFETFKWIYQGWVEIFEYCSRKKGWGLLVYIG